MSKLVLQVYLDLWKIRGFENKIILESKNFILEILISKMGIKMNLRIIRKNYAADPEKGFLVKSILRPFELSSPFR